MDTYEKMKFSFRGYFKMLAGWEVGVNPHLPASTLTQKQGKLFILLCKIIHTERNAVYCLSMINETTILYQLTFKSKNKETVYEYDKNFFKTIGKTYINYTYRSNNY